MPQITNAMDYREIYETLNDQQLKALGKVIDYALKSGWPNCVTEFLAMQQVLESDLCLNKNQLLLFNGIVKYIVENRERVYESIYEAMKKEFFESMDRLMAEQDTFRQEMLGDNK